MTVPIARTVSAALVALACLGCSSNRHLVFTTSTKFGVDISGSASNPTGLMFGYKRFEGAVIPVDPSDVDENGDPRMPAVFSALDLENGWFSGIDVFQVFATGQAAIKASENPAALAKVVGEARDSTGSYQADGR